MKGENIMEINLSAYSKIDPKNLSQDALDYFLHIAASENDADGITYFINLGADISHSPYSTTTIYKLIKYRNHEMICYLFMYDTQNKLHNSDVLYQLVRNEMHETVDFLLSRMKRLTHNIKITLMKLFALQLLTKIMK